MVDCMLALCICASDDPIPQAQRTTDDAHSSADLHRLTLPSGLYTEGLQSTTP